MAVHLYSGPKTGKARRERQDLNFEKLAKKAQDTKKRVPSKLRFEELIKNKSSSPCSLNDFVDYLVYVEREAEPLQFFLWYCDYVRRWTALSPGEKSKAPRWDPDNKRPITSHSRNGSLKEKAKLGAILDILEREPRQSNDVLQRKSSSATNFSFPRSPAPVATPSTTTNERKGYEAFSDQPFRDEITKVVRHYISAGAPRQLLSLSAEDRAACIHAVAHTTNPTALLPAFVSADAVLRGRLHPAFLAWTVSNANRPLVFLLRLLSAFLLLLGAGLEAVLILSSHIESRLWRLFAFPLFLAGVMTVLASRHGLCPFLHWRRGRGRRQLRPWEQASDLEQGRMKMSAGKNAKYLDHDILRDCRMGSVDPLRKPGLQTFGPRNNDFADEDWVAQYGKKWLFRRVFDVSVGCDNKYVRSLQDRVVGNSVLWGGITASVLCGACYFIPSYGLF